ncbi:MAG: sulfurtransferase [Pseudomonadota bacterium]
MSNAFKHPEFLLSAEQLTSLQASESWVSVRLFDCTTHLDPAENAVYTVRSGRAEYDQAHIPGAGFMDLQGELSDPNTNLRFMLPEPERFAEAVAAHGVSNESHVILYSSTHVMWATRVWWMFRAFGHDRVSVLDGGLGRWQALGYPTTQSKPDYPPGDFMARPRAGHFVDRETVLGAINDGEACVLNALSREQHIGETGRHYGRPGRIARSVNVEARSLTDDSGCFLDAPSLRERFEAVDAMGRPVIAYCGGGIAATADVFALALLGHQDLSVYDASLSEWANHADCPMEVGEPV